MRFGTTSLLAVAVVALVAAGLLTWQGATLLLDAWWRRWQRPDLAERLRPFRPDSLADEAQRWLNERYRP